jgi:GMP synthase PP-ATPase subunit
MHKTCLLNVDRGTLYPDVIESLSFKGPSATIKVSLHLAISNA